MAAAERARRDALRCCHTTLPVLRVEREDHVADLAGLARQLDVAADDALEDLVLGEPLLLELRGVVVAEDARSTAP